MTIRVAINGFGRIGRLLARELIAKSGSKEAICLRAIVVRHNGDSDLMKRASLLRRDSVHGSFDGTITIDHSSNAIIANGTSPATHEIVFLFPSMTSLANWSMSSRGKPAMQAFQAAMEQHTSPVGELIGSFGKSWGTPSNDDRVWVATRFYATDAAAVVAALDKLMSDRSMKKFPGNLGISSVSLGNQHGSDMMTHMIFAGYESAEEMENWTDYYTSQPAWGEYLQSLQGVVTWLSTELVQNALVFDGKMDVETFTK